MLPSSIVTLLTSASTALALVPLLDRASLGCIADNCLRAVAGSEPGQPTASPRIADYPSFLLKTITPHTVTVTSIASFNASSTVTSLTTTTTTSTISSAAALAQRDALTAIASNVPAYAI